MPRDIIAVSDALGKIPTLKKYLEGLSSPLTEEIYHSLDPLDDIRQLIIDTLLPSLPAGINQGDIISGGINDELDELRLITQEGDAWIRSKEEKMRQETGISNLKIGHNSVFGYYIEVSRAQSSKMPSEFIRKQTLVNQERFISPDLKEMENKIFSAKERLVELERDLFIEFRKKLVPLTGRILNVALSLAVLDVLSDFAAVSLKRGYVRPVFNDRDYIYIKEGRHPVIEESVGAFSFVPNSTNLDGSNRQIIILTGPNMSGKSTYLRQNALIVIMAQMGCFVPAEWTELFICDKLFCRVGASDNIVLGRSTFLTEMIEAAHILNNCTDRSLVFLDEIGRGTSTYDGLSLAWAITEFLHDQPKRNAKTIFATHYHELTVLEKTLSKVRNYQVSVSKQDDEIRFLHRIKEGGCDDSYGIYVAKLAGIPHDVLKRATEIMKNS